MPGSAIADGLWRSDRSASVPKHDQAPPSSDRAESSSSFRVSVDEDGKDPAQGCVGRRHVYRAEALGQLMVEGGAIVTVGVDQTSAVG